MLTLSVLGKKKKQRHWNQAEERGERESSVPGRGGARGYVTPKSKGN
jgi:hypothetical protein